MDAMLQSYVLLQPFRVYALGGKDSPFLNVEYYI